MIFYLISIYSLWFYFVTFFQKRTSFPVKLTHCTLKSILSDTNSVLVSHVLSNNKEWYTDTDPFPSISLTVEQCTFTNISSSVNGGVISLTLNSSSSSSLSLTDTIIQYCSASQDYCGAVYPFTSSSSFNYQFTNVTHSRNSDFTATDIIF